MQYGLDVVTIRMVKEPTWYSENPVSSPEEVAQFISKEFAEFDREVAAVLNLSMDGRVINMNIVSVGALNNTEMQAREVFKSSILSNAAAFILVHNHPSGRLLPSREDKLATQKMREAGNLLGIELLDHLIVGDKKGHYFSFREENILNNNFYLELLREERKPYER